jgi:hypothetical protein
MGSGYKTFTAGAVLTASDVQNYLQDQSVMVFGGTAARSSAIGTANFEEGMLTYLTDVDKLQVYTGAAFADVYPAAASTQGLTLINTTSFSAVASQAVNTVFSSTYKNYRVQINITLSTGNPALLSLRLRNATTDKSANYVNNQYGATGGAGFNSASITTGFGLQDMVANATEFGATMDILNPFETQNTICLTQMLMRNQANAFAASNIGGIQAENYSADGLNLVASTGNITGRIAVYGYNV